MKETIKRMKGKIFLWLKEPNNIVLFVIIFGCKKLIKKEETKNKILLAVGIFGIIEGNLIIIIVVYLGVFLFGHLVGWLLYLKNRFFS